jgi:transcriptional regulator with XRE-family HTH domain
MREGGCDPEIRMSCAPFGLVNQGADAALQIRVARKRAGISQVELARRMSVSQQQVQRLEDPNKSNPTMATLRAIAKALGLELRVRFD